MPGRLSFGQTLVVAALLHGGLFVLGDHVHAAARRPESPMTLVAVEVTSEPTAEPPPPEPLPESPAVPPSEASPALPSTAIARRTATEVTPASSAVALPESAAPLPGGWTIRVTQGPGGSATPSPLAPLSVDPQNRFMGRRETEEDAQRAAVAQANRAAGEAMRSALHDHDAELGLGGGGPVVTALEASVRDSTAPDESRAVLVAIADESGNVLRVDVESTSDAAAFQAVAEDVLKRLRGQRLRVPAGSHGLAMRIDVASRMANPSGGGVGLDPLKAGAHFDLADMGSRPHRVIHARVINEEIL
jgi:hypothetical protein